MEPSKTKTVCFTEHRPKGIIADRPYDESNRPVYQKIVDGLTVSIERLIEQGYTNFISGGAQGFDQLAFWAVNIIKARRPEIQNISPLTVRNPAGQRPVCSASTNTI